MEPGSGSKRTLVIRQRGTLTLPARVRARYGLEEGVPVTLIDLDGSLLLIPETGLVADVSAQIERLREAIGLSVQELVDGVREERRKARRARKPA